MIIEQIKLNIDEDINVLPEKIKKKFRGHISNYRIVKESIDARDKQNIKKVYSVEVNYKKSSEWGIPERNVDIGYLNDTNAEKANDVYNANSIGKENNKLNRPIVIGFGPAGMFSALALAKAGLKPIVLERGNDVDTRVRDVENYWNGKGLNTESNVQFGEGGAGTFSDGKLTTGTKDFRIRWVLEEFVSHGAPDDILYKSKPHIGTDILRDVVKSIRKDIISLGGEVIFGAKVIELVMEDNDIAGVTYINDGKKKTIKTSNVILAIGHSSRDTFRWLCDTGIEMEKKPFSIGVRIEHDQDVIDTSQYGRPAGELGLDVSAYKLSYRCENGRGVYTFCMCPGGRVIAASSQRDGLVTNGMSNRDRGSGKANSALLVDVRTEDFESEDVLAGVYFQEKYEHIAFVNGLKQYAKITGATNFDPDVCFIPNTTWGELKNGNAPLVSECIPSFALDSMKEAMPNFGKKIKGFDSDDALIYAVEARSSSPVRILRDENLEGKHNFGAKPLHGFYPCGEGAGYAGGIMSAAVDGIKVAEKIIEKTMNSNK